GWRAEMCDPAREKDGRRWAAGRHARVDAHVVDRHQHHRDAADDVDRANPCRGRAYRPDVGDSCHAVLIHRPSCWTQTSVATPRSVCVRRSLGTAVSYDVWRTTL